MLRSVFSIDGLDLSVASSGQGKPFIFQHGLCGAAEQVTEVFPVNGDWKCITLESRGHGLSPCGDVESLSIQRFVQDIAEFIRSLECGPVPVGGISMGAAIAMQLAIRHPDLVRGLVIARPAWIDKPAPESLFAIREVARYLTDHATREARARFEASPIVARIRREAPDNLTSLLSFFHREPVNETRSLLAAIANDGPGVSKSEITGIDVPTLVIGTQSDVIHPMAMADRIAELIPSARLVEITAKSDSRDRYCMEFQNALNQYMKELG
ncbi:MAG: alpha/beta fold hydrolase [Rhizobiaceae bacterium]